MRSHQLNHWQDISVEQEIQQVSMSRPHVVILGAGASRAALPHGDAYGRRLPLMADFLEVVVGVRDILMKAGLSLVENDFEATYSRIVQDPKYTDVVAELESVIFKYFDSLRLPDNPTLYDHLLLSLREKDVIANLQLGSVVATSGTSLSTS